MAQKQLDADPRQAAARLVDVQAMLIATLESVRRFSRDLRPIYLEDLGFLPALEMLARPRSDGQTTAGRPATTIHFQTSGAVHRLPPEFELAAYRIVQEALSNVTQHAHASQAWVHVRFESEHLGLSVRDDGQGFVAPDLPDTLARQGHFGLMGIRERALLYGGQLSLRSAPGEGTELYVRLPYPQS
jgi:signal transduction histidine kinase